MINKRQYQITSNKPILHKKGKQWIVISLSALALAMGVGVGSTVNTHASQVNTNVPANKPIQKTPVTKAATQLHSQLVGQSNTPNQTNNQPKNLGVQKPNLTNNATQPTQSTDPNDQAASNDPSLVNSQLNNHYHFNNAMGRSNDIEGIIPNYNADNKSIKNWDIYYLWNPIMESKNGNGTTNNKPADQWALARTKNFNNFQPVDNTDPKSIKNVAIPDPKYSIGNKGDIEVDPKQSDDNEIPWGQVAGGSVVSNKKSNGQQWLKEDSFGYPISANARLAYFATYNSQPSADGNANGIYLAYANPVDHSSTEFQQFRPFGMNNVMDGNMLPPAITDKGDFRDPQVIANPDNPNQLVAYVAGGATGNIYELTSNNAVDWNYVKNINLHNSLHNLGVNTTPNEPANINSIETPHLSVLNGQPIMFFSAQDNSHNEYEGVYYVTGDINKSGLFEMNNNSKVGTIDGGIDNYAGNFANLDANHLIYIGWIGNWADMNDGSHVGGFSLPRVLTWDGQHVESTPVAAGTLVNSDFDAKDTATNMRNTYFDNGRVDLTFPTSESNFEVQLGRKNGQNGQPSMITVNFNNGTMTIGRYNSANDEPSLTTPTTTVYQNKLSKVEFYVDRGVVEMYLPEAHQIYSISSYGKDKDDPYYVVNAPANTSMKSYQFDTSVNSADQPKATFKYVDFMTGKYLGSDQMEVTSSKPITSSQMTNLPNGYQVAVYGDDELPNQHYTVINNKYDYQPNLNYDGKSHTYDITVIPKGTENIGYIGTAKYEIDNQGNMLIQDGNINATHNKYVSGASDGLGYRNSIKTITMHNVNANGMTNMSKLFYNDTNLTTINFDDGFDTSKVSDMSQMFQNDSHLKTINFPKNFKTNNVTDMHAMFQSDNALSDLDLSQFDTAQVKDLSAMFYGDTNLKTLNLGNHFSTKSTGNQASKIWGFINNDPKLNAVYIPNSVNLSADGGSYDNTPFTTYNVDAYGNPSFKVVNHQGNQPSGWYYTAKQGDSIAYNVDGKIILGNGSKDAKIFGYLYYPANPDNNFRGPRVQNNNYNQLAADTAKNLKDMIPYPLATIDGASFLPDNQQNNFTPTSWGGVIFYLSKNNNTDTYTFVDTKDNDEFEGTQNKVSGNNQVGSQYTVPTSQVPKGYKLADNSNTFTISGKGQNHVIHVISTAKNRATADIPVHSPKVTFKGTIDLHFHNGKQAIKDIFLPYQLTAENNIPVKDLLNSTNPSATIPTDYLNKIIQSFNTNNFSYDNNAKTSEYDDVTIFPTEKGYVISKDNSNNVFNNPQINLDFSAKQVNENIHYSYKGQNEGNTQFTGYNDEAGSDEPFTKPENNSLAKGLKRGFRIAPVNPNNKWIYGNEDKNNPQGSDTVNVVPEVAIEDINYVYHDKNNQAHNEGSEVEYEDFNNPNYNVDGNGMYSGYELKNKSDKFTYSDGQYNAEVVPAPANAKIQYVYNGRVITGDNKDYHGNNYQATDAGNNGTVINSNNDKGLPSGWHLVNNSTNVQYDNQYHQVQIAPDKATDLIKYQVKGTNKIVGSTIATGNNSQDTQISDTGTNITSDNDEGLQTGYHLDQASNPINYDGQTHYVPVDLNVGTAQVHYITTDGSHVPASDDNGGNGTISGTSNSTIDNPTKSVPVPSGYHLVNPVAKYQFGIQNVNNDSDNPADDIDIAPNTIKGTATLHLIYKQTDNTVDSTKDINIPINTTAGSNNIVVSPWTYAKDNYNNNNSNWIIPINWTIAKNGNVTNYNPSDTFTYVGKTAGDLKVQYVDVDPNAKAVNNEQLTSDTHQPIISTQDLGNQGPVGTSINLGATGANDGNGVRDILNVPAGWLLVHKVNPVTIVLTSNGTTLRIGLMLMAPAPEPIHHNGSKASQASSSASSASQSGSSKAPSASTKPSSASSSTSTPAKPSSASSKNSSASSKASSTTSSKASSTSSNKSSSASSKASSANSSKPSSASVKPSSASSTSSSTSSSAKSGSTVAPSSAQSSSAAKPSSEAQPSNSSSASSASAQSNSSSTQPVVPSSVPSTAPSSATLPVIPSYVAPLVTPSSVTSSVAPSSTASSVVPSSNTSATPSAKSSTTPKKPTIVPPMSSKATTPSETARPVHHSSSKPNIVTVNIPVQSKGNKSGVAKHNETVISPRAKNQSIYANHSLAKFTGTNNTKVTQKSNTNNSAKHPTYVNGHKLPQTSEAKTHVGVISLILFALASALFTLGKKAERHNK